MNVFEAAQTVKEGKVHIRKEFICLVIARHAAEQYSAQPVILSSMCKHGLISDSVQLIMTDLRAWKSSAFDEILWGPIWSIASDRDATCCGLLYNICMTHKVPVTSGLYQWLHSCIGLNLWVSKSNVTMNFDYKHVFKRKPLLNSFLLNVWQFTLDICMLLCSKEDLLVNSIALNKLLIALWLGKLTMLDWSDFSALHALLNPKDL